MAEFVAFGEIMMRMAPAGFLRMQQVLPGSLEVTFAGAEANVAASLAMLGATAKFVTALPDNPLTDACLVNLCGLGVDTSAIRRLDHGRFGIYFVETGANQRPGRVTYDREFSSISMAQPTDFDWDFIFHEARWLHLTGITAALSESAALTTLEAARQARARGVRVACDINFRSKLWRWNPELPPMQLAGQVLQELIPSVDLLMANAEDCRLLGVDTQIPDELSCATEAMPELARRTIVRFPNLKLFATTLRENISASHNNWGAMLYDSQAVSAVFSPIQNGVYHPWQICNIVDRVGAGDAFAAGLLYALNRQADYPGHQAALNFATAASCLAHSVVGDFNFATRSEIDELAGGSGSGRVVR